MPSLLMGTIIESLFQLFPERASPATQQLLSVLAHMAAGQGMTDDHPHRIEAISAMQGRLLLLPVWLTLHKPHVAARREELERWAVAFGRTWECREAAQEDPTPSNRQRAADADRMARQSWPSWGPFSSGGPLGPERFLPLGMS